MLIGLCGLKRSGKDETAKILKRLLGAEQIAYGDELKSRVQKSLKGADYHLPLTAFYEGDRELKLRSLDSGTVLKAALIMAADLGSTDSYGKIIEYFNTVKDRDNWSIRRLMQVFGTDIGVNIIDVNIWIKYVNERVSLDTNWIISDARQHHEFKSILDAGGIIINIVRVDKIDSSVDNHITEQNIGEQYANYVLHNDHSMGIASLEASIKQLLSETNVKY